MDHVDEVKCVGHVDIALLQQLWRDKGDKVAKSEEPNACTKTKYRIVDFHSIESRIICCDDGAESEYGGKCESNDGSRGSDTSAKQMETGGVMGVFKPIAIPIPKRDEDKPGKPAQAYACERQSQR